MVLDQQIKRQRVRTFVWLAVIAGFAVGYLIIGIRAGVRANTFLFSSLPLCTLYGLSEYSRSKRMRSFILVAIALLTLPIFVYFQLKVDTVAGHLLTALWLCPTGLFAVELRRLHQMTLKASAEAKTP